MVFICRRSLVAAGFSSDAVPLFQVEGRLRPEDRPQVNVLAPTPDTADVLEVSMTQEHIELLLSPQGGRG